MRRLDIRLERLVEDGNTLDQHDGRKQVFHESVSKRVADEERVRHVIVPDRLPLKESTPPSFSSHFDPSQEGVHPCECCEPAPVHLG